VLKHLLGDIGDLVQSIFYLDVPYVIAVAIHLCLSNLSGYCLVRQEPNEPSLIE
jgi:hypothetical protein